MDEYINREELINNRPEGRNPKQIGKEEYNKGWNDCRSAFYALIEDMPAIDVAQVRNGEWIACGDGDNVPWMCSHCGKTTASKYKIMYGKYCPNCGAKMDLEEA